MVERLGFKAQDHVDPFDGGPYLAAKRDEIPIIRHVSGRKLVGTMKGKGSGTSAIVSMTGAEGFRAVRSRFELAGEGIRLPADVVDVLGVSLGESIGLSLFDAKGNAIGAAKQPARRATARSRSRR